MGLSMRMLVLSMFSISALAQSHPPLAEHATTQLDEVRKRPCDVQMPEGFTCAVLFNVGTASDDEMIASIVGENVSQISVYVGGTLYTVAYDPPLKRDDRLRKWMHVPVRIVSNDLILQWPDQTRSKGKIIRREAVFPNRPQPA